jgi:pimeloyl-ACP methyl ester carboxylesterase
MLARLDFCVPRPGSGTFALKYLSGLLAAGALLASTAGNLSAASPPPPAPPAGKTDKVAAAPADKTDKEGYFFVGGHWVADGEKKYMVGQMFVQYELPTKQTHPYPIVMVHGTAQTGSNYLGTPDDRPGWASYFRDHGYRVYVVDQVGRGRSGQSPEAYGPYMRLSAYDMESIYTGQENYKLFPEAQLHTQWPGGPGVAGNASFDQFFSSQVQSVANGVKTEELNDAALIALLEKIGPAVLLTHSQAGVFGWKIADDRPELVKGLVAVEPNGPPFYDPDFKGGDNWYVYGAKPSRAWGITRVPLHFEPPLSDPAGLNATEQDKAEGPGLVRCWLQGGQPHQLPNLKNTPIAIVTSEASFRSTLDHCTSEFLTQAGVKNEHIQLAEKGIHGNGHMMMLEKNNLEVAGVLNQWISAHIH